MFKMNSNPQIKQKFFTKKKKKKRRSRVSVALDKYQT